MHFRHTTPNVHCELSPNSTLLNNQYLTEIGDSGVAKVKQADHRKRKTRTPHTVNFMSPIALLKCQSCVLPLDIFLHGETTLPVINKKWPIPLHLVQYIKDLTIKVCLLFKGILVSLLQFFQHSVLNQFQKLIVLNFLFQVFIMLLSLILWLQNQFLKIWLFTNHARSILNVCARFNHHDECWGFTSGGEWLRTQTSDLSFITCSVSCPF